MAGIDINRGTSGVALPSAISNEVWANTIEGSAVMQLANQIALPGNGVSIPIITGDPEAGWVAETGEKPVSRPTLGNKEMTPYKLAVIVPFSNEFRRDLSALYDALVQRLPSALAKKFDTTVMHGTAPGDNFDTLAGAAAVDIKTDTYGGLIAADAAVAAGDGALDGWIASPAARAILLTAKDGMGRPLFINNVVTDGAIPALLGQAMLPSKGAYKAGTPNVIGFGGDWSGASYGTVEGVQVSFSDQATLQDGEETINLWQRNMFAVRAEIEVGFRVRDIAQFVKLTDGAES